MLPVLGVSVLVQRGGKVLLVRRARPPLANAWALPGGRVIAGEPLVAAAAREVMEETGLAVRELARLDVVEIIEGDPQGDVTWHYVLVVFSATADDEAPVAGDDAAEARWMPIDELSRLAMAPDTARILGVDVSELPTR